MTFPVVDLVAVRRTVDARITQQTPAPRVARMTIVGEKTGSVLLRIPYAPVNVEHSELGGEYALINRPGLGDATSFTSPRVPRMAMTLFLADRARTPSLKTERFEVVTSTVSIIQQLKKYSEEGSRVRVTYGVFETGLWYIDGITARSLKRDPRTDEVVQAEVDLTLVRASDVVLGYGPVTGGVKPPAPAPTPPPPHRTSARYYTVKRGDTLWGISIKFYGTGTKWRIIADENHIRDPRLLQIGFVLRIP